MKCVSFKKITSNITCRLQNFLSSYYKIPCMRHCLFISFIFLALCSQHALAQSKENKTRAAQDSVVRSKKDSLKKRNVRRVTLADISQKIKDSSSRHLKKTRTLPPPFVPERKVSHDTISKPKQ